jgi:acyl-CoA thioester hydrolase
MDKGIDKFNHQVPVQIRFNDLDVLNHVNNIVIQEYFDLGRLHYLQLVLDSPLYEGDEGLIIVSNKTDFAVPVLLNDQLEVKTKIYHLGTKSVKMIQELVDQEQGTLKAKCESVMVAIDKATSQSIEVPLDWRHKIRQFENLTD